MAPCGAASKVSVNIEAENKYKEVLAGVRRVIFFLKASLKLFATYDGLLGLGAEAELPVDIVVNSIGIVGGVANAVYTQQRVSMQSIQSQTEGDQTYH